MKNILLFFSVLLFNSFILTAQCPTNGSAAISSLPYTQSVADITTAGNDFNSGDACGGNWMSGEDYTYTYTPLVDECINITVNAGGYYGLFLTDDCPDAPGANCIDSDNIYGAGTMEITDIPVTAGVTYYITVSYWPPSTSSFDITVTSHVCIIPPTPGNCTNMTINTTMFSQSGLTTCGYGDDFDYNDACGSFYMNGDDIVIEYIPTTSECVKISLTNTNLYTGLFIMDGCAFDSGVNCLASSEGPSGSPSIQTFNVTAGTSYFIHVSTNANPQCTTFDLDISSCPPISACGNIATNDYCSDPVTIYQSPTDWTNTTNDGYTPDEPANMIASFCGTIENNSWYIFTALSTTETFAFSGIGGAYCGSGIQALVYDVTTDSDGCCTNFNLVSNCYNPVSLASGTVTATSLVIGNQYYLMIDGNTGSGCDFTVANWGLVTISALSVELIDFQGYNYENENKLNWTTKSEINNDYFIVQKSSDGKNFTDIGYVKGHGNSNSSINYEFIDQSPSSGHNYYRLKQFDFDGKNSTSYVIVIGASRLVEEINVFPNPFQEKLTIELNNTNEKYLEFELTDQLGNLIIKKQLSVKNGRASFDLGNSIPEGLYVLKIVTGNTVYIKKIIKSLKTI